MTSSKVAGKLVHDHVERRALEEIGGAQIALHGIAAEAAVLHEEGVVEAQLVAQRLAVALGDGLADQSAQRIAQIVLDGEADEAR